MIPKPEILAIAKVTNLLPSTVEKDYVLSWVLNAISKNAQLSEWIFKGGTCLKKCYFETYRFSEDLDFTVPAGAIYDIASIKVALTGIARSLYDETGIEIKTDTIEVQESFNKNQAKTFEAKFGYIGPLNYNTRSLPRIKFDITNDEFIAEEPDLRNVYHSYSDAPATPAKLKCYSINEILAEKTRALYQREGRARDIYDVINIGRNFREDVHITRALACLKGKFKFKQLPDPTVELVVNSINFDLLKGNWIDQLGHQLPVLPPVESFYADLRQELSWWIEGINAATSLAVISNAQGENAEPKVHFPQSLSQRHLGIGRQVDGDGHGSQLGSVMDQIRYAARNRLCIAFNYSGVRRVVEPYSLRRPRTGNLLLYVIEKRKGDYLGKGICSFNIEKIGAVEILQEVFIPSYLVEL